MCSYGVTSVLMIIMDVSNVIYTHKLRTSRPELMCLCSGQTNALPAYAASMCSQIFWELPAI